MMKVSELEPQPNEHVTFKLPCNRDVPEVPGCYVLTTFQHIILYIGQSTNISGRMNDHLNDEAKKRATPFGKAFWFYYMLCDAYELNHLERGWTNHYRIKEGELSFFNLVSPPI